AFFNCSLSGADGYRFAHWVHAAGIVLRIFAFRFAFESNRFSQSNAFGNSEKVLARKPRFAATSAPNPFIVGGLPTSATFGVPEHSFSQCPARVFPNSYRSKLDSSPLTDRQSTRTLSKPLSVATSRTFVNTAIASLNETGPSSVTSR